MLETKNVEKIKCVVWDLDNTIWEGTILEDSNIFIKKDILNIIKTLDNRGILQSISSKNDFEVAMKKLVELKIDEYFLYPQINWNSKSESISAIAEKINISKNTIAFIDDQQYELDEVKYNLPEVLCINSNYTKNLLDMPEMTPIFITEDSAKRRNMYINDIKRNEDEKTYAGPKEEFLRSLNMKLNISIAKEYDLQRAEELTIRTNQLNSTGYTYSYDELNKFRLSPNHILIIVGLDDKYGTYGKIGLALIECKEKVWTLKLLLMSCRVMSRGIGSILLNYISKLAIDMDIDNIYAEFVETDRNRVMYITYKFAGFNEMCVDNERITFYNDLKNIQKQPDFLEIIDGGLKNEITN